MPLFEYECRACGRRFEHLTRSGAAAACPSCNGVDLEKLLSVFAVSAGEKAQGAPESAPCGRCGDPRGPGACAVH